MTDILYLKPPVKYISNRNFQKPISRYRQLSRASSNSDLLLRHEVNRRPSLPPINQSPNSSSYDENERDFGGETSGYGSDNPNQTTEERMWKDQLSNRWECKSDVKTFWESTEDYSKISDAPGWLKRGLQRNVELVVANSSPSESPEQDYKHDFEHDRPSTGSSVSQTRSFIRGQNVPLDPTEIAEREQKRIRALAHQEAIKQQLEEKERKRREERERKLREEREEELRLEREKEIERKRLEQEQQILKEKKEREQKRKEAMREALELAQKQAEERRKQKSQQHSNSQNDIIENKDKSKIVADDENNKNITENCNINSNDNSVTKGEAELKENDNKNLKQERKMTEVNENVPVISQKPISDPDPPRPETSSKSLQTQNYPENLALVMQAPMETLNSMQFAVLVPTINSGTPTIMPIAVPITLSDEKSPRTINRILTPSTYRQRRFCDSSTQTENSYLRDRKYSQNKGSAQTRTRNYYNYESRSRRSSRIGTSDSFNLSDRPKWGANRPHTRYLKQSEKDPFYQRRKSRMKRCQGRSYDVKSNNYSPHSSDDSEPVSANTYSNNELMKKRTRALWQKTDNFIGTNLLKTEIIPLETHNDQLYYRIPNCEKCFCRCHITSTNNNNNVDILKIDHDQKDNISERVDNNLNNSNEIQVVNKDVIGKLTNTFQNQLKVNEEKDSCSSVLCLSNETNKDN